jgi:hypothetical protein
MIGNIEANVISEDIISYRIRYLLLASAFY